MDCAHYPKRLVTWNFISTRSHTVHPDMVISVKETTVFSVFHPDAQDLYNTCSDLKKVAWTLWDTSYRLNADVCIRHCGAYDLSFKPL